MKILAFKPAKKFVKKKLVWYAVPNLILNSMIPYFNFENPLAVTLFQGEFCFARFILPMALFLPFAITVDCMKKLYTFIASTEGIEILSHKSLLNNRRFFQYGIYNGVLTFLVVLILLITLQSFVSPDYRFNGFWLSAFNGFLAFVLAIFFTWWSIQKLESSIRY